MLLHCVFCALRSEADPVELQNVMGELAALKDVVDGMLSFQHGPNRDFESKSPRHGYGFIIAFRDRSSHLAYDGHPGHKAAGGRLVALCKGGYDGIMVYDLEADLNGA